MIRENHDGQNDKPVKHKFRRTGPLDAYIYQKGSDEEHVEESQNNVVVHLPLPLPSEQKRLVTHVFTDGACTNNGKRGANAAWGVIIVSDPDYKIINRISGPIPKS